MLAVVASGNIREALRSQALRNSERTPSWLGRNITRDFSLIQLAEKGQLTAKGSGRGLLQQTARVAA